MEARAGGEHPLAHRRRHDREDLVDLAPPGEADAGQGGEPRFQLRGADIGLAREIEPQAVPQIGLHLRAEQAPLRQRMAAALAPVGEILRTVRIEEDYRFAGEGAVLGRAEGQDVDARLPAHFGRRQAERDEGVGETGAVHVDRHAGRMGDFRQCRDLGLRVEGAAFSRLGESERLRLDLLDHAARHEREGVVERGWRDLASASGKADQLGPGREKFRRAAFVRGDMRKFVAENGAPGIRDGGQRQRIRRRARGDQKDLDLALENVRQRNLGAAGPLVRAISGGRAAVGVDDRLQDRRMGAA